MFTHWARFLLTTNKISTGAIDIEKKRATYGSRVIEKKNGKGSHFNLLHDQ